MLTILQCVQAACQELGLTAPPALYTATDLQTIQLGALINRDLAELRTMHQWTDLKKSYVITVGPAIVTTGTYSSGGTTITAIPTTAAITPATSFMLSGSYLNQASRVVSVDSATQVTIDIPATGAATAGAITFVKDTFSEPTDFDRFIDDTWWDLTNHWILMGPDSSQRQQQQVAGIVASGPRRHFIQTGRASGSNYRLWPPISSLESNFSIEFQYISKYAVQAAGGTYKERFTVDTDLPTLEDNMMILGVKWRFFQIKQLDYAPLQAEYIDYVNRRIVQDGGATTLRLDRGSDGDFFISPANVQDGNFPS